MIFAFDDFELDDALFELRREGTPVPVAPRVFDTILFLVRNQHRVVTKDELMKAVWQGAVVTDDALSQAVRKARGILGVHGSERAPIQTVRGRGYRFLLRTQGTPEMMTSQPVAIATSDDQAQPMVGICSASVRTTPERDALGD